MFLDGASLACSPVVAVACLRWGAGIAIPMLLILIHIKLPIQLFILQHKLLQDFKRALIFPVLAVFWWPSQFCLWLRLIGLIFTWLLYLLAEFRFELIKILSIFGIRWSLFRLFNQKLIFCKVPHLDVFTDHGGHCQFRKIRKHWKTRCLNTFKW